MQKYGFYFYRQNKIRLFFELFLYLSVAQPYANYFSGTENVPYAKCRQMQVFRIHTNLHRLIYVQSEKTIIFVFCAS